ncbi:hypothetical protein HMPREF0378_1004 [Eubacterium nodatum ATCC 33099]|nr:hypothetical protein HMPREF0378_1004 [Eubacterium nodatum ATCC 33099]
MVEERKLCNMAQTCLKNVVILSCYNIFYYNTKQVLEN